MCVCVYQVEFLILRLGLTYMFKVYIIIFIYNGYTLHY